MLFVRADVQIRQRPSPAALALASGAGVPLPASPAASAASLVQQIICMATADPPAALLSPVLLDRTLSDAEVRGR